MAAMLHGIFRLFREEDEEDKEGMGDYFHTGSKKGEEPRFIYANIRSNYLFK